MMPKDLNSYVDTRINTCEKYVSIPRCERERRVWFWPTGWFKKPYALLWTPADTVAGSICEWTKVERYLKNTYPIQYRVREAYENSLDIFYRICSSIRRFYNSRIRGHRRQMRNTVFRREYRDLDTIVVDFSLQCLIEFVDREKGIESHDYTYDQAARTFAAELKECYDYAISGRKRLVDAISAESERAYQEHRSGKSSPSIYNELTRLEKELEDYDTKVCEWVVRNRGRLWT